MGGKHGGQIFGHLLGGSKILGPFLWGEGGQTFFTCLIELLAGNGISFF